MFNFVASSRESWRHSSEHTENSIAQPVIGLHSDHRSVDDFFSPPSRSSNSIKLLKWNYSESSSYVSDSQKPHKIFSRASSHCNDPMLCGVRRSWSWSKASESNVNERKNWKIKQISNEIYDKWIWDSWSGHRLTAQRMEENFGNFKSTSSQKRTFNYDILYSISVYFRWYLSRDLLRDFKGNSNKI